MKYQTLSHRFESIPVNKSNSSQTVPDMSFTPREILAKFSRGERVPLGFSGKYDSEDDPSNDMHLHNLGDDPMMLEEDPTRDPTFDFGDFVEENEALKERQRSARRRSRGKDAEASKRKARHEELSASDATSGETTSGEAPTSPNAQSRAE